MHEKLKKGWTHVAFGDVVRQVRDHVDPDETDLERYVAGEHMDTDDLKISRWGVIGDGYLGPAFHMRFKSGHVLYGSRRTYLRKVAVADFDGITANTTFVLETKDPKVLLPELLPFIMQTESFHEHSIKQSKGSVNPYINYSDLTWYEFALPPLDEQRRIAEVLRAADICRSSLQAAVVAARALAASAATHLLKQDTLATLHSRGTVPIPPHWKVASIGDVCERITYGFTNPMPTTDSGPWMVTAADVRDGRIDFGSARHTSQEAFDNDLTDKSRVRIGDVLLTKDGSLGRIAVVDRPDVCINQSVAVLRSTSHVRPPFLAWALRAPAMQVRLMLDVGGSAVKHIYITKVAETRFLLPPLSVQDRIVAVLDAVEGMATAAQVRTDACARLSRTILARGLEER